MRRSHGIAVAALAFSILAFAATRAPAAADAPAAPATRPLDREALEKDFAQEMTGAVMAGRFTMQGDNKAPGEDKYSIVSAVKNKGDEWTITARIQYGGIDISVPVPVIVMWAGDTPVIEVTNLTVPGMGAYTARVLVYKGQYAGTWSSAKHGGQMFGRIEHPTTKPATQTAPKG